MKKLTAVIVAAVVLVVGARIARAALKGQVDRLPMMIAGLVDPNYPTVERVTSDEVTYVVEQALLKGKPSIQLVSNRGCPRTASLIGDLDELAKSKGFVFQPFFTEDTDTKARAYLRDHGVRTKSYSVRPARGVAADEVLNQTVDNIGWMPEGDAIGTPYIIVRDSSGRIVRQLSAISSDRMSAVIAAAGRASR